ncbi:hypothetical protein ACX6XY_29480 [Streptomyces sp. O3]
MAREWPVLRTTDFESMTHAQLVALLASADSAGTAELARGLASAAKTIAEIGDDLKAYVGGLPWRGEGGDAFREWGGQSANAALRLGEYGGVVAVWLGEVSQAIAEAKASMPPLSETTTARAAEGADEGEVEVEGGTRDQVDAMRADAVLRLRKLAQTYVFSGQQLQAQEPPVFPPPAMHPGSGDWSEPRGYRPAYGSAPEQGGGTGTGTGSGTGGQGAMGGQAGPGVGVAASGAPPSAAAAPPSTPSAAASSTSSTSSAPSASSAPNPAGRPALMEIDSVAAPPQDSGPPPSAGPASPPGPGRPDAGPALLAGAPPPLAVVGDGGRTGLAPPASATGAGRPMGTPGPGSGSPGTAGRTPRDGGVIGGRPTWTGNGLGGGAPGRGGSASGRHPAHESGGIVGGVPQRAGRTTGGPFAAGGTGPVPGGVPGLVPGGVLAPPPAASRPARRDAGQGDRSGRAVEEGETWRQGRRPVVPPVVDR